MSSTPVRVRISRGINGQLVTEGAFAVVHAELTEGGKRISLSCREVDADHPRVLNLQIPVRDLEELSTPDAELDALPRSAERAVDHVLARLPL